MRRRGSVRQRANGSWEGRLYFIDPVSGQRKRVSFYGPTEADVWDNLDEAADRLKVSAPVKDSRRRLADWIEHWAATTLEASPRKPSTKQLYATLARKHLTGGALGATRLDRLRKSDVEGLIVRLRTQGLSDSTVRQVYTVLRSVLEDARLDGLIAANPTALVRRPKVHRSEARHLDLAEVSKVLQAAQRLRYQPVLALIAATGLRRGEALGLHWADVDLKAGVIKVTATLGRAGKKLELSGPKSERSRRPVPLSPAVVALLKARRIAQAEERLRAGELWVDNGLVFTTESGTPVEPRNVLRTMETAAAKAGLEDIGVHTLRHSAAVAWLEAGVHIKAVADLLGHSSISVTGDVYGHTSDAGARAAIDGLSDGLGL